MPRVVCLGIIVVDVWAWPVDQWPEKGRLLLVDEIGIGLGGHATNSGRCLAKLGVDVAVMGCIGQDGLGDFALEELQAQGVETTSIYRTAATGTAATLIMVDGAGERTFVHAVGADGEIRPQQLDMDLVKSAQFLYMAGALAMPGFDGEPQAQVMAEAQQAGLTTVLDVVWDATGKWLETLAPVLPHTDIFLPSLVEAQEITGHKDPSDVAAFLLDTGIEIVGLTNGAEGVWVFTANEEIALPAYEVDVVDGSGAGDAFTAGFVYGCLHDWELERTARFACAMGALATTTLGTTTGIKDYQQVLAFLQEREPQNWE